MSKVCTSGVFVYLVKEFYLEPQRYSITVTKRRLETNDVMTDYILLWKGYVQEPPLLPSNSWCTSIKIRY